MPLLIPDPDRKTPDSIDLASDLCTKWCLWHRGDHLDSIICCKLFPTRHRLTDAAIASVLGKRHEGCVKMTGKDVAELYHFLKTNPDLHTNSIRLWEKIKATPIKELDTTDDMKVELAIARFTNHAPIKKH